MAAGIVSTRSARGLHALRAASLGGIGLGAAVTGLMHVLPLTAGIDPLAVTISEYGRSSLAMVFVVAVLLIAVGSAAALVVFVQKRACRLLSVPTLGLALWVIGLLGVALFEKADWVAGATLTGYVHRAASVVAFVALPVAILALVVGHRRRRGSAFDRRALTAARVLTVVVLAAILALAVFIGASDAAGSPWWTMFPIGLAERALVFCELAALTVLAAGVRLP